MHRFFLPPENIREGKVVFPDKVNHQLSNVLRFSQGDQIKVFDGNGLEFTVSLRKGEDSLVGEVQEVCYPETEHFYHINLYHGLLKKGAEEFLVQKASELGVSKFSPFVSKRTVVRKLSSKKQNRLERICQEAVELSGGVKIPSFSSLSPFSDLVEDLNPKGINILAWEEEKEFTLKDYLSEREIPLGASINIFLGPEGGFSSQEVNLFQRKGEIVSLGKRVMRAETAALFFLSALIINLKDDIK